MESRMKYQMQTSLSATGPKIRVDWIEIQRIFKTLYGKPCHCVWLVCVMLDGFIPS